MLLVASPVSHLPYQENPDFVRLVWYAVLKIRFVATSTVHVVH